MFFTHILRTFLLIDFKSLILDMKKLTIQPLLRFIIHYFSLQYEFLTSFLNIIDLLGILPFYLSLSLNLLSSQYSLEYIAKAAQIFRILRILRIFKLSRHITGLKTLGTTLRNSHRYVRCTNLVRNRVISMFFKKKIGSCPQIAYRAQNHPPLFLS